MGSEWPRARLGDVAAIVMGQSPPGDTYNDDGVGAALVNGPAQFGTRTPVATKWTTAPTKVSRPGDVVFCVRGSTTGRMVRADGDYCLGRGVASIRGDTTVDSDFVYYALQADLGRLLQQATGSTFPNLSSRTLDRFDLPWPETPVRHAIAEVLGALDGRIEWCDAGTSLAHALAQSVAEQLEADGTVRLRDVADIRRSTISATKLQGHRWTHYSIPAFDDGQQPLVEAGSEIRSGKFSVPPDSVLVSKLNPTWPRVWLPAAEDDPPAICSTELMPVVPRSSSVATTAALWAALLTPSFNRQLRERVQGSTGSHQRVRPEDMLACRVMDPAALTANTGLMLASLAARVLELRVERRSLVSSRDALLPRLLSGEVRIEDPARVLGAVA